METTARVTLKRLTRPLGDAFRSYKVMIDGKAVGAIKRRQTLHFDVGPGHHEIHLEIDFCRSKSVEADLGAGEEALLTCRARSFNAGTAISVHGVHDYVRLDLVSVGPAGLPTVAD